jgi:hypothetical protein
MTDSNFNGLSDDDYCSGDDDILLTTNPGRDLEDFKSTSREIDNGTQVTRLKKDQNWSMANSKFYGLSDDDEPSVMIISA